MSNIWICAVAPFATRTQRTREEAIKESRRRPEGLMDPVGMASQYLFLDGEGPTKNRRSATPMSDVSSMDDYHRHRRVLEPIPLLPTQPLGLTMPSAPVTMASGSMTTTTPATPTKTGATVFSKFSVTSGVSKTGACGAEGN